MRLRAGDDGYQRLLSTSYTIFPERPDPAEAARGRAPRADPESALPPAPDRIPVEELPALPARDAGYYTEPCCGICIVLVLSILFSLVVTSVRSAVVDDERASSDEKYIANVCVMAVFAEASTAVLMLLYLLFASSGVIRRSPKTCYPIPPTVEDLLRRGESLEALQSHGEGGNIKGEALKKDRPDMPDGSYCVRCLVWRPNAADVHHCRTCGRCVVGFDHHCGVLGRCIVRRNMPCFSTLVVMLFAGPVTAMVAMQVSSPGIE
ncbi:unnamed protein product [Prorocentrum cordatum]|uniref:Palmitoyltransferase n=1 Tax=Prorocentrum cordatum TaxID=2364126 RepID=A0ABN9VBH9_9DINO|nr:unnamed protein product [Polarella glacialis]